MIAHVRDKLCKLVQLHNISFVRILPCVWNGFHLFCVVFSLNITTMNEKWPVDFCKQTNKKMCTQNWVIADRAREEKIQSFFYARDSLEKKYNKKRWPDEAPVCIKLNLLSSYWSCCCWRFFQQMPWCKSRKITMENYVNRVKFNEIKLSKRVSHQLYRKVKKKSWWNIIDWQNSMKTTWHVSISTFIVHFNGCYCICSQLTWHWDMAANSKMNNSTSEKTHPITKSMEKMNFEF